MKLLLLSVFFLTALQLHAASKKPKPINDTVKVAPIKKELGNNQESPTSKDNKIQKQNAPLHNSSSRSQPINPDNEIARVKKQLREIQASPISKNDKIKQQKMLLDREIATVEGKLRDAETPSAEEKKDHAQHLRDAIVDFLQKLSSINPQLK